MSKKCYPLRFYALAIDSRIHQGDKRLPKSIAINNNIWQQVAELQVVNYSKRLDSALKIFKWNLSSSENKNNNFKKPQLIKVNKILPHLGKTAIIYKEQDWFLEVSSMIFSIKGDKAVMVLRTSSKNEILDMCVYFFDYKNGNWVLAEEISPFLF
ncbi:MAG: hypothetical protein REI64_06385 [Pedobacter sp.]|uniref:hypothetical protein n=1 Tax=Pedobacter sp. TaxID=1411316 RepID=UPI0028067B94|nr:hypothetical protein [Pedobacter sp.]MDQ8004411.1 hypothetical protein [Pedobacter sp.]